jgi:hypothetical protein
MRRKAPPAGDKDRTSYQVARMRTTIDLPRPAPPQEPAGIHPTDRREREYELPERWDGMS